MKYHVPTHASVIINDAIYFDPYNLPPHSCANARYILITHAHYDHYSPADIQKIITPLTKLVVPADLYDAITKAYPANQVTAVTPGQSYQIDDLQFTTFAAYNLKKQFHPKDNHWVGYNVVIEKQNVVVCGDTDATPELLKQHADLLFIPIGGTYTMDTTEAANATNQIQPRIVVPIHYGSIVGTNADVLTFQNRVAPQCQVILCLGKSPQTLVTDGCQE